MHTTEFNELEEEYREFKQQTTGTPNIDPSPNMTKDKIFDEIVRFFVNEMIPLKKVESPHLKRLLLGEK